MSDLIEPLNGRISLAITQPDDITPLERHGGSFLKPILRPVVRLRGRTALRLERDSLKAHKTRPKGPKTRKCKCGIRYPILPDPEEAQVRHERGKKHRNRIQQKEHKWPTNCIPCGVKFETLDVYYKHKASRQHTEKTVGVSCPFKW